jgi:hypothetical protein
VELTGFEPLIPSMRTERETQLSLVQSVSPRQKADEEESSHFWPHLTRTCGSIATPIFAPMLLRTG